MVPADDEHTDSPEATSDTNKNEHKPGHLTAMPDCLMHWWTPLALAVSLFLGSMFITSIWGSATFDEIMHAIQDCPKRWPFHMRTPSREEIEVCLTITAAGFAFSAWQQRNHDNIAREEDALAKQEAEKTARETAERNRRKQIERDEYWKRREHILHTLDSDNPGIRLAAISLLAELADSAAHSTLLNPTAQQQLQQHIISTLCLQLRHEGQLVESEGTKGGHTEIQNAILQVILERIQNTRPEEVRADWSQETIDLSNSNFTTDLLIDGITSASTIKLNGSHFQNGLGIFGSKLGQIDLNSCIFDKYLYIGNKEKPVTLHCEAIAITSNGPTSFENTTFITDGEKLFTSFQTETNENSVRITFKACKFYNQECECPTTCSCKSKASSGTCQCLERQDCYCSSTCINATIETLIPETGFQNNTNRNTLMFSDSKIRSIELLFKYRHHPSIQLNGNTFTNELKFYMDDTDSNNTINNSHSHIENDPPQLTTVTVKENTFITIPERPPISISITTQQITRPPFKFSSNYLISTTDYSTGIPRPTEASFLLPSTPLKHQQLVCKTDNTEPERYHFSAHPNGPTSPLITPWDSGRFCPPNSDKAQMRYSNSLACSCLNTRNNLTIIKPSEDTFFSFLGPEILQDHIEIFISLANNSKWPGMAYTLNDIDIEHCYFVYEESNPQALFCLTPGDEDTYLNSQISWNMSSQFNRIHSISTFGKQGIFQSIFNYAAAHSKYLRCDTNEDDHAMRHALEVFGFKECGTFVAEDGSTRIAYDWIKEPDPQV